MNETHQSSIVDLGKPGAPGLILYDGVCVLCSGWFRFVAERDTARRFMFTAIQSDYGRVLAQRLGIDPENPQSNAVLLDGKVHLRLDSALAALGVLPGWRWMRVFRLVPRPLRDAFYGVIARNRYRWFGKKTVCDLGGARYADRIIG
ncbi:MAG TPA: DCC1-like thiol-disulfide oxidoreductase family protein [Pseudolabrys sp.]|nr:DCC1-like thiol-disulfide oxidoreductase family protein [Pseudolabrys sp.]